MKAEIATQSIKEKISTRIIPLVLIVASFSVAVAAGFGLFSQPKKTSTTSVLQVTLPPAPDYELADVSADETAKSNQPMKHLTVPSAQSRTQEVGKPAMPLIERLILLPPDVTVKSVDLTVTKQRSAVVDDRLAPVQPTDLPDAKTEIRIVDGQETVVASDPLVSPDAATYASTALYPANVLQEYQADQWGNYDVLRVIYAPWQYNPGRSELLGVESAQITVTYQPKPQKLLKRANVARDYITAQAKETLLNPEKMTAWYGQPYAETATANDIDLAIIQPDHFIQNYYPETESNGGLPAPTKSIFAINQNAAWVVGAVTQDIAYHVDAGRSSVNLTDGPGGPAVELESVAGLNNGTIVAVGGSTNGGVIFYRRPADQPLQFTQVTLPAAANGKRFYAVAEVDRTNPNSGFWVVGGTPYGASNIVFKAPDIANPNTWQQVTVPASPNLRSVYVVGTEVFAVGDQGTILHFNGSSWSVMTSPVMADLTSIDGSGPSDVWAVGAATGFNPGTIMQYNGSSWINRTSENPDTAKRSRLNVVEVLDSQNRWVGGDNLLIMHWASNRWVPQFLPHFWQYGNQPIKDVADVSSSSSNVWLAGTGLFRLYSDPTTLDAYIQFRQNQGYQVETKTVSEIMAAYPGAQMYERIQAYLLDRYTNHGLTHVLLLGMAWMVPAWADTSPAEDNDREYRNIIGSSPNELFVSRVLIKEPAEFLTYFQKVVANETRADGFTRNALLAADTYPAGNGLCATGPHYMELLKTDYFLPRGYSVTTLYDPPAVATDILSAEKVQQYWNSTHPFLVSMEGHGSYDGILGITSLDWIPQYDSTLPPHVWVTKSCNTSDPDKVSNIPSTFIASGTALSYIGAAGLVLCPSHEGANLKAPKYFDSIIENGQPLSEAFWSAGDGSDFGPYYPAGDPLVGPPGMDSRVLSFHVPTTRGIYRAVTGIDIVGSALGPNFQSYSIEWGSGSNPAIWSSAGITLDLPTTTKVVERLGTWNTSTITNTGQYTLRLTGTFNGQIASRQITFTIDNQACVDGTAPQMCSVTKPKFCQDGQLGNVCSACGCPNVGDTCTGNGSCIVGCVDGTPLNACSNPPGSYCDATSQLVNLASQCASADGVRHTQDDCNLCNAPGMYCSESGDCRSTSAGFGLLGDYYEGSNFETLRTDNAVDPIIDFGPRNGDAFLETLIDQRVGNGVPASIRWDGFIYIETDQPITYYLQVSNDTKLYIDNLTTPILSNSFFGASVQKSFAIGWHPIRIEFQQSFDGDAGLQLGWKVNGADYVQEHGGGTFPMKLQYIIPHTSLVVTMPKSGGGGGGPLCGEENGLPPCPMELE